MSKLHDLNLHDEDGNAYTAANSLPVTRYTSGGVEVVDSPNANIRDESGNAFTNSNTLPVTAYNSSGTEISPATEATLEGLFNLTRMLTEIIKNPNWLSQSNNALQVLTMANSVITTVTTVSTVTTVTGLTNIGGYGADQITSNVMQTSYAVSLRGLYT